MGRTSEGWWADPRSIGLSLRIICDGRRCRPESGVGTCDLDHADAHSRARSNAPDCPFWCDVANTDEVTASHPGVPQCSLSNRTDRQIGVCAVPSADHPCLRSRASLSNAMAACRLSSRRLRSGWDEECPQRRFRDARDVSNAVEVVGKKNLARPKVANLAAAGLDLQYAGEDDDELGARRRVRLGVLHLGRHLDKDDGLDGYGVREKQRRDASNDERLLLLDRDVDESRPALTVVFHPYVLHGPLRSPLAGNQSVPVMPWSRLVGPGRGRAVPPRREARLLPRTRADCPIRGSSAEGFRRPNSGSVGINARRRRRRLRRCRWRGDRGIGALGRSAWWCAGQRGWLLPGRRAAARRRRARR
jgi:hypothetical protein